MASPPAAAVVLAPFHLGRHGVGVAAGPRAIAGAAADGMEAAREVAAPTAPFEASRIFEIARAVAAQVAAARHRGQRALVLAGECSTAVGTIAGTGVDELGVVWLDAHADFNTPETSASGFLEGMALAMVMGRCWRTLCASVPAWRPLAPDKVVLAGARSLDPCEREALSGSALRWVGPSSCWQATFEAALDDLATRVSSVYLHVDLDVLDAEMAAANAWSSSGGLAPVDLARAVEAVGERFTVEAAALTALDPMVDRDGAALRAAVTETERILRLLSAGAALG